MWFVRAIKQRQVMIKRVAKSQTLHVNHTNTHNKEVQTRTFLTWLNTLHMQHLKMRVAKFREDIVTYS